MQEYRVKCSSGQMSTYFNVISMFPLKENIHAIKKLPQRYPIYGSMLYPHKKFHAWKISEVPNQTFTKLEVKGEICK